jgi:putative phosphoesterase
MRVAVISDIHGNLPAFEAALADILIQQVDQIVCLGDVAAGGPQPREVIARLRDLNCPVVMGNADEWLLNPQPGEARDEDARRITAIELWGARQLASADLDYVRTFQATVEVQLGDGATLLCFHGSPRSNTDIIRATTPDKDLERMATGYDALVMAGGHTHAQMLRRYKDKIIINPGSVGMPYEAVPTTGQVRNPPWAECANVNWSDGRLAIDLRRVPFDAAAVVQVALASGMPHAEWWTGDWR